MLDNIVNIISYIKYHHKNMQATPLQIEVDL